MEPVSLVMLGGNVLLIRDATPSRSPAHSKRNVVAVALRATRRGMAQLMPGASHSEAATIALRTTSLFEILAVA